MIDNRIRDALVAAGATTTDLFCTVHRVDSDRLVTLFSSHPEPETLGSWQSRGQGIVGWAAETAQEVSVSDAQTSPYYAAVYPSIQSELAIPVVLDGRVAAVINFESTSRDAFARDDERFHELALQLRDFFLPTDLERFDTLLISEDSLWQPLEQDHVRIQLGEISDTLLQRLAREPELMHQLSPRKFEELIARVLADLGLNVTLTPTTKDGGFDIFAELATPLGTVLTLVECKKYSPSRPVSVEVVRNLYGVLSLSGATRALIATTSRFTADARALQDAVKYRLELRDYFSIASWLARYDNAR